jgi:hypothetical protein
VETLFLIIFFGFLALILVNIALKLFANTAKSYRVLRGKPTHWTGRVYKRVK